MKIRSETFDVHDCPDFLRLEFFSCIFLERDLDMREYFRFNYFLNQSCCKYFDAIVNVNRSNGSRKIRLWWLALESTICYVSQTADCFLIFRTHHQTRRCLVLASFLYNLCMTSFFLCVLFWTNFLKKLSMCVASVKILIRKKAKKCKK